MEGNEPLRRSCPDCRGPMEQGHVMGTTTAGGLPMVPTTLGWLGSSVQPKGRGLSDMDKSVPLVEIGSFRWSASARFPAWRCTNCSLVVFSYADPRTVVHPDKSR